MTPIPRRLSALARARPRAVAIWGDGGPVTYRALVDEAGALAGRLRAACVGKGGLVGVCLPRSARHVAAVLSIWQAGAAVLFLDPSWPALRLRALLRDSRATAWITTGDVAATTDLPHLICIRVDEAGAHATDAAARPRAPGIAPDDLAYVVYTSGSTGEPKGVEITHGNLDHLIGWHRARFVLGTTDRVAHLAGLGFDAAVWEVWPALCAGASIVPVAEEARAAPDLLAEWLVGAGITMAFVPTLLAEILIRREWPAATRLRVMLTGGETLRHRPRSDLPFTVVNNYGPSECTVVATSGIVAAGDAACAPDIGRAIDGVRIHILDEAGEEANEGEIAIAGALVGRGYRGRPDLTARAFVTDRFTPPPRGLLYLTGDRGRRQFDGSIAFLGRADEQEQIRGIRVEPEEVSLALAAHEGVAWCRVIGRGEAGARRLVAFVLAAPGAAPRADGLRAFLAERLPDAAIPAAFIMLDSVPLTASGKLDRDALEALDAGRDRPFRAAGNAVERRVAGIVAELTGTAEISVDDNFFLLGGQSLMATQLVLRIRSVFGVPMTLRDVFEAQTVERIAEIIAHRLAEFVAAMSEQAAESWAAR